MPRLTADGTCGVRGTDRSLRAEWREQSENRILELAILPCHLARTARGRAVPDLVPDGRPRRTPLHLTTARGTGLRLVARERGALPTHCAPRFDVREIRAWSQSRPRDESAKTSAGDCVRMVLSVNRRGSRRYGRLGAVGRWPGIPSYAGAMERTLRNGRLKVIQNVGHCPHLSSPSASTTAIDEFLLEQNL